MLTPLRYGTGRLIDPVFRHVDLDPVSHPREEVAEVHILNALLPGFRDRLRHRAEEAVLSSRFGSVTDWTGYHPTIKYRVCSLICPTHFRCFRSK